MKFEKSISRLEQILKEIESDNIPLDELLELFNEANKVASKCQVDLNKVKSKMKLIIKENNLIKEKDLE